MSKFNIYCKYSRFDRFPYSKGDYNTEFGTLLALNTFADVYYGGRLFDPNILGWGMDGPVQREIGDCDCCYTRASPETFDLASGGKRIMLAFPYDELRFSQADLLVTFSDRWSDLLRKGERCSAANPRGIAYPKVETAYQVVPTMFRDLRHHPRVKKIRKELNSKFIIGYFGRLSEEWAPTEVIENWAKISKACPGARLVVACNVRYRDVNPSIVPNVVELNLKRRDVPYYLSACDVALNFHRKIGWDYKGSIKTAETMACGVPLISLNGSSRREQLGEDYPLLVEWYQEGVRFDFDQILSYLNHLYWDAEFRVAVGKSLLERSVRFRPSAIGARWKSFVERVLK